MSVHGEPPLVYRCNAPRCGVEIEDGPCICPTHLAELPPRLRKRAAGLPGASYLEWHDIKDEIMAWWASAEKATS